MWFSWYVLHMTFSENEFRFEFMEKVVFLLLFREEVCCDIVYPTVWCTFTRSTLWYCGSESGTTKRGKRGERLLSQDKVV